MKIIERVPYGEHGDGCLVRYEGVATWYSVYHQHGIEHRRTTKKTDLKAARKAHRDYLNKIAAEKDGGPALPTPKAAQLAVAALLDELKRTANCVASNGRITPPRSAPGSATCGPRS